MATRTWVETELGGPGAQLTTDDSATGVVDTLERHAGERGCSSSTTVTRSSAGEPRTTRAEDGSEVPLNRSRCPGGHR